MGKEEKKKSGKVVFWAQKAPATLWVLGFRIAMVLSSSVVLFPKKVLLFARKKKGAKNATFSHPRSQYLNFMGARELRQVVRMLR